MNQTPKIWPWVLAFVVIVIIGWIGYWLSQPSAAPITPVDNVPTETTMPTNPPVVNPSEDLSTSSATTTP